MTVSCVPLDKDLISAQRRTRAPHGVDGGEVALMGRNTRVKQRRGEDGDVVADEDLDHGT